jgi:rRNA maturation endonuclease Nob1
MRCEHCGAEQANGKFCDNCGRMLTRVIVEETAEEAAAAKITASGPLKCSHCGTQQSGGHFCDNCGLELDIFRVEEEQAVGGGRCHQCGHWSKVRLCPNCGIPIRNFVGQEE